MNYTIEYSPVESDSESNNFMKINRFTFKFESSEISLSPIDIVNLVNTVKEQAELIEDLDSRINNLECIGR